MGEPSFRAPNFGTRLSTNFQFTVVNQSGRPPSGVKRPHCCSCQTPHIKSTGTQSFPSPNHTLHLAQLRRPGPGHPLFAAMSDTWLPNPSRGPATREPQYVSHKQDERRARLSQDRTDPLMPSPTFHSTDVLRVPSHVARSGPVTGYPPTVQHTSYDDGLDDFGMYCPAPVIVALLTRPRQECSRGHYAAAQLRR